MGWLKKIKKKIAWWLVKDLLESGVPVVKVTDKLIVGDPSKLNPDGTVTFQPLTADPTLEAGKIWYRSDVDKWYYSPDGASTKVLGGEASATAISPADTVAANLEVLPDSYGVATFYSLNPEFITEVINSPNISGLKIHNIFTDPLFSGDTIQYWLYQLIDSKANYSKVIDIITASAASTTYSANASVTGVVRYRNLTINSGVTLTVGGQPGVIIANSISNAGTILKSATGAAGGPARSDGGGAGGRGGGGLIIIAGSASGGTYSADGGNGGNWVAGGFSGSAGSGYGGGAGNMNRFGTDSPGNGGAGSGTYGGAGGSPGAGGGGAIGAYSGGAGGSITLTTQTASIIAKDMLKAAVDWYIVNVLGKTLTTQKSFINGYGSGGGSGACADPNNDYEFDCAGGGGGSGGLLLAVILSIDGGTFTARGGNGGVGGRPGVVNSHGGGGGGGLAYVLYQTQVNAPAFDVSGGAAGGTGAGAGTAGVGRAIQAL